MLFVFGAAAVAFGADGEVGSKVCSTCHAAIYKKFAATSMAQSSGRIGTGEFRESFDQASVGGDYSVSVTPEGYRLDFSRGESGVQGQRLLNWFVGSGRVARSYITSMDGFLYQSPVSYYSLAAKWDISPGYQQHQSIHLTRAIGTGCLQCHASRLQAVSGTPNKFLAPPFLEGGVSCERCHGPGKNHAVVNPAKLEPARRDSVCAQCHLTGAARIVKPGIRPEAYKPGELLSDYAAYFVWTAADSASAMGANSHFEKLQQSACKRVSGDKMWCGSCHDAHGEPEAANRVSFYRARCQKCHTTPNCKESMEVRRKAQDDCTACHMPKSRVRDTEHAVFTDHTVPRRERQASVSAARTLASFWKAPTTDRDLGLALAMVAGSDAALRRRAFDLLRKSEERNLDDVLLLAQLAQFYDQSGDEAKAMSLSERVLRLDPSQVAVAVNLGTYYMQRGRAREALRLWADALSRNPALTSVSMNLAVAQFQSGDAAAAEATLRKALEFDPDHENARKLLLEIRGQ